MIWTGFAIAAACAWLALLLLPWRPWSVRERLEAEPLPGSGATSKHARASDSVHTITVLIPARDEAAGIARTIRAVKQQAPELTVIVIDDQSTDDTATIARREGALVIDGQPLPEGWTGKLWALEQGRHHVNTDWILQLDADIELAPGMLNALRCQQQALQPPPAPAGSDGYDLVSIMALLPTDGFWQRLLLPAYVWFFKLIYPFRLANGPWRRLAAAAGGCILIRRALLASIGGYAALRHAVIDDCTLAALCKKAGGRTWLGLSRSVVSHRAGESLRDMTNLVARTAYTQLRHSFIILLVVSALLVFSFWLPPAALLWPDGTVGARLAGGVGYAAMAAAYLPLLRLYRLNPLWALLLPVVATLYLGMTWLSARRHWRGVGAYWKGRSYQDQAMKKHAADPRVMNHPGQQSPSMKSPTAVQGSAAALQTRTARETATMAETEFSPIQIAQQAAADGPVFIIGSPRSGTSVLHWSLLQHEKLWGSEESEFMLPLARALRDSYASGVRFGERAWLVKQDIAYEDYCAYLGLGIDRMYRDRSGGLIWVEQTPAYSVVARELALMFPSARFIYIHRDGRKVNESMRRMWQWPVEQAAQLWVQHNQPCLDLAAAAPHRVQRLAYEALVMDPEPHFRQLFEFLQLDYTAAATRFLRDRQPINVSPGTENESGRDKLAVRDGDWQPGQLEAFWQLAGEMMQRLGYDAE